MKTTFKLASQNAFVLGLLVWAVFLSVTEYWPASQWFEVRSVRVHDAVAGEPVRMKVDREIKVDFLATWVASVRHVDHGVVCVATGDSNYRKGAALPDPLTLEWWTYGQCKPLAPGRYFVATDWTIHPQGIWPEKTVRADSNVFEVRARHD